MLRISVVLLAVAILTAACGEAKLHGTSLNKQAAHDFRLTDQFGQQVGLSDFRGQPVVVTFLYTTCPDVCPLTAERLRLAVKALGSDAARIGILAVSVDPEHDDVEAARRFSEAHEMLDHWHYLVGQRAELEPVWKAYYIGVAASDTEKTGHTHEPSASQPVGHTDAVFLIDKQGRMRSLLRSDFDPKALAEDLRTLLRA